MSNLSELGLNVEEESKNALNFDVLPEGDYSVIVSECEMKNNSKTEGSHVSATLLVIEGEYEGRMLWANYNVKNSNSTAEKIGRAELAALCKAINIANPTDTEELKNIPLVVKVGIDKKDPAKNKIKQYISADIPKTKKPVTQPNPVTAATGKKPWQK